MALNLRPAKRAADTTVLALDIGRTTGWARSDRRVGEISLHSYADDADAWIAFSRWIADQLSEDRPALLLIERAFFVTRIRDGDFSAGLIRLAHMIARLHDVPRAELAANTVRARVFGRARGVGDAERVRAIREMGWQASGNHEADAVALLLAHQAMAEGAAA